MSHRDGEWIAANEAEFWDRLIRYFSKCDPPMFDCDEEADGDETAAEIRAMYEWAKDNGYRRAAS